MKTRRFRPLRIAGAFLAVVALTVFGLAGSAVSHPTDTKYRWDIVSVDFAAGTVTAGGVAAALAHDGSQIVLTGSGTFRPGAVRKVTGGGTWRTFGPGGAPTGMGTYKVTRLISFVLAPGTAPPLDNKIGNPEDARAGLAHLGIRYSDGRVGVLTVSCHLVGTPDTVFEGVIASKRFVTYFDPVAPVPGVDANRTLFHVVD